MTTEGRRKGGMTSRSHAGSSAKDPYGEAETVPSLAVERDVPEYVQKLDEEIKDEAETGVHPPDEGDDKLQRGFATMDPMKQVIIS